MALPETIVSAPAAVTLEWLKTPIAEREPLAALRDAVVVALGTDRLAEPDDELPDPNTTDRRGWWGDMDSAEVWGGWPIGARFWLLARAKITDAAARQGATLTLVEDYAHEAMQPFIDAKIATSVDVVVTRIGLSRIDVGITLFRGARQMISLRYQSLWGS